MNMYQAIKEHNVSASQHYVKPALIIQIADSKLCNVEFIIDGSAKESWAMLATPGYQPSIGDKVLITGESADECYIIGVLSTANEKNQTQGELCTKQGAVARLVKNNHSECLQIENQQGQILFQYHPEQGTGILSMPEGDLALQAPKGNIHLLSGKSVVCSSAAPMVIESASAIDISVKHNATQSSLQVSTKGMMLKGERLGVTAQNANVNIDAAHYKGKSITGTVESAKWIYQKLENIAERILERARNVYRYTDALYQTKAGRMRTLVQGDYYVKGEGVDVRAEKIAKIDGEKVHLG